MIVENDKDLLSIFQKGHRASIRFHYDFELKKPYFELRYDQALKQDIYQFNHLVIPAVLKTVHKDIYSLFDNGDTGFVCWASNYIRIQKAIFNKETNITSEGIVGVLDLNNDANEHYFVKDNKKYDIRIEQLPFEFATDFKYER